MGATALGALSDIVVGLLSSFGEVHGGHFGGAGTKAALLHDIASACVRS